jgi:hypothetical protein
VIILQLMAQRASADHGPRNGAESWALRAGDPQREEHLALVGGDGTWKPG